MSGDASTVRRLFSAVEWPRQAPRWSVAVLASVMAADLAQTLVGLRTSSAAQRPVPPPPVRQPMHSAGAAAVRISHAHLFGSEKVVPDVSNPATAAETRLEIALTGTIATPDPNGGYAILGEKGKATHLYHTGGALGDGLSGRLYQTFTDRVVLELDGHLETLRLPRQLTAGLVSAPVTVGSPQATAVAGPVASLGIDPAGRTAAEAWFELLHPQHQVRGNQAVGIKLRPDMRLQRQYDLRYNDVLTAINGVDISGPDSLDNLQDALKGAGKSLSLTVMRDGVQQVLTVPVTDDR